tara:strand:- start:37 stop:432 length:396 start_codon:yes stop_codon:yes gene_type:complete
MFYASLVIIVNEEGSVLSLKRSGETKSYPLKWGLPGGKRELLEMPEDCAIREIREETALTVKEEDLGYFYLLTKGTKDFYCFIVTQWSGDLTLNEEHEESHWVPYKELKEWLQVPTDDAFFIAMEAKIDKL